MIKKIKKIKKILKIKCSPDNLDKYFFLKVAIVFFNFYD